MDSFGILGFVMGSTGMTFGIIAWSHLESLSKDFKDLKKTLIDSGVIEETPDTESQ